MKAIYDEFTNDATLVAALTGGMYGIRANPKVSTPYCVYDLVGNSPSWTFAKAVESGRIQFSIFADTDTVLFDCGKKLMALYDFGSLTMASYSNVGLVRENNLTLYAEGYYQYVIDYRMMIYAT